jgi:hypothetical protein
MNQHDAGCLSGKHLSAVGAWQAGPRTDNDAV